MEQIGDFNCCIAGLLHPASHLWGKFSLLTILSLGTKLNGGLGLLAIKRVYSGCKRPFQVTPCLTRHFYVLVGMWTVLIVIIHTTAQHVPWSNSLPGMRSLVQWSFASAEQWNNPQLGVVPFSQNGLEYYSFINRHLGLVAPSPSEKRPVLLATPVLGAPMSLVKHVSVH